MKILAVDDERAALNHLTGTITKVHETFEVRGFSNPKAALEAVEQEGFYPDVAFLDIEMFGMTGIELAKMLKDVSPSTKIIFVTAHSQYALDAFSVHARGYLLKPVVIDKVREELSILSENTLELRGRIYAQTFGNFEVFTDGKPIEFKRSKSKEILAYLVDRKGASATKKEIAAVIWGDAPYSRNAQIYLQTLLQGMIRDLQAVGAEQIVLKRRNSFSVCKDQIDCDYYLFEQGDSAAINAYGGEYMSNYEWAEFTIGYLDRQKEASSSFSKYCR